MGGERLRVDLDAISSLATNLGRVHTALSEASRRSDDLAAAAGQKVLADTLSDFTSKWEIRRTELTEQVDQLREMANAVDAGFSETDQELARAIRGDA